MVKDLILELVKIMSAPYIISSLEKSFLIHLKSDHSLYHSRASDHAQFKLPVSSVGLGWGVLLLISF